MQSKQSCLRERDVQRTISADRRSRGTGRALCRITLLDERRQVVAAGPSGWARLASALLVTSIQAGLSVIKRVTDCTSYWIFMPFIINRFSASWCWRRD